MITIAIITNGGHAQRALDFYDKSGKYFIIGGTTPWETESTPPAPTADTFTLDGVIGLKSVDNYYIVKQDDSGSISYNDQNWKIVSPRLSTTLRLSVSTGDTVINLDSVSGLTIGSKVRVNGLYEGSITQVDTVGRSITLDTASPSNIDLGSVVLSGAVVEGAHHIYLESILKFDEFPVTTYRQVGLCIGVEPSTGNILLPGDYTSIGTLEIIDNRPPMIRNDSMSEKLCVMLEF